MNTCLDMSLTVCLKHDDLFRKARCTLNHVTSTPKKLTSYEYFTEENICLKKNPIIYYIMLKMIRHERNIVSIPVPTSHNQNPGVVSLVRVCNDRYGAFVANELRGSYAADGNLWKETRVFLPVGST